MKTNEKLKRAFASADEDLFAAAENAAFTPSADFERRAAAIVRKKNGVTWRFVNTAGKKVAAAALALLIVAAAVFAVPAVRRQFGKNNVTEDAIILYRSENGDITVRVVEPLENPIFHQFLWAPITEEKLKNQAEVFVGTIQKVEEVEISYVYEGVTCTNYNSLLTVRADDMIKEAGSISEGTIIKALFPLSTRWTNEDGIYPHEGKEYVFFLQKTEDSIDILDLTSVADYYYRIAGNAFIPLDEEQNNSLLTLIGAEEGTCGEEFIEALKKFYK